MRFVRPHPLSTFGWSLLGALALTLSLPPVGFYPLAWGALVPILLRWSLRTPSWAYVRELYALFLTTACCAGFWLLFNPDLTRALLGGLGLLLAPLPLVAAMTLSSAVRARFGTAAGLTSLVLGVLSTEFLLLQGPVRVPWLLLGHTQAGALPFVQTADLGGVLMVSLWVLLLNAVAFVGVAFRPGTREPLLDRGLVAGIFGALAVLPAAYGAVRINQTQQPSGYLTVGLIQPGMPASTWDDVTDGSKVDYVAGLSDNLLDTAPRAPAAPVQPAALDPDAPTLGYGTDAPGRRSPDLLVWPRATVASDLDAERRQRLFSRLALWSAGRGVSVLTGAVLTDAPADPDLPPRFANAALLFTPGERAAGRYDQMVTLPVIETVPVDPVTRARRAERALGTQHVVFDVRGTGVAALVGFESLFGDHVRRFAQREADVFVVLAQNDAWGRVGSIDQQMGVSRLRAIETRRPVVVSTVSGTSALITPDGRVQEAAGWMQQGLVSLDVPTLRMGSFYTAHGDWLGGLALGLGLVLHGGLLVAARLGLLTHWRPARPAPPPF
ncbi:MAG: apolipoprotein N-acyltransferase [Rubricoccaceae bacterium]